jgi:hypothetical protein
MHVTLLGWLTVDSGHGKCLFVADVKSVLIVFYHSEILGLCPMKINLCMECINCNLFLSYKSLVESLQEELS